MVCGSLTFDLLDSRDKITLNRGGRLELAAGVNHGAVFGRQGDDENTQHREILKDLFFIERGFLNPLKLTEVKWIKSK